MNKINYLPLGSVVVIKGGVKKYVIVSRGLKVNADGKEMYFDYAGCKYPEGVSGDRLFYFHHKDIVKEVYRGYADEDDALMVENINEALQALDVERADIDELKRMVEA